MSDPSDDEVTEETRSTGTGDEVAENYEHQSKLGAQVEGEGQID